MAFLFGAPTGNRPVIVCLPHAGAGASVYRSWRSRPSAYEACPWQYPGHETRLAERPATDIGSVVSDLVVGIAGLGVPYALFGHSLGALVAFEAARTLSGSSVGPVALVVSGCVRPPLVSGRARGRPSAETGVEALRLLGGTPAEVLEDVELLDVLLPAFFADQAMVKKYTFKPGRPLDCPIAALGGADDPLVGVDDLARWSDETEGPFASHVFPGGHFFLREHERAVREVVDAVFALGIGDC